MDRPADTIIVNTIEDIPSLDAIREMPRERTLTLIFEKQVQHWREAIGDSLKKELIDFQVSVNIVDPIINIGKLISEAEVEANQLFFEQCAKDYRKLGEELIFKVVDKLGLTLNRDLPMETFTQLHRNGTSRGKVEDWNYNVHGFHCGFHNETTEQHIEVSFVFGLEFGDLDPYFFSQFIKSTPEYSPLPVAIFEDYADGQRINEKMISLGKFEKVNSNVGHRSGVVVSDRKKVEIRSDAELLKMYEERNKQHHESKSIFGRLVKSFKRK